MGCEVLKAGKQWTSKSPLQVATSVFELCQDHMSSYFHMRQEDSEFSVTVNFCQTGTIAEYLQMSPRLVLHNLANR